jgi:Endosomal/lysosomal potassium channel TMEM175
MPASAATVAEGDELEEPLADNSLGRLLALSDGVFAIAMTLLALDLRLPDLGATARSTSWPISRCCGSPSHVRAHRLGESPETSAERLGMWADIVVFAVSIPGAYVLRENGAFLLLALVISGRLPRLRRAAGA